MRTDRVCQTGGQVIGKDTELAGIYGKSGAAGHMVSMASVATAITVCGKIASCAHKAAFGAHKAAFGATLLRNFRRNCGSQIFNGDSANPGIMVPVPAAPGDREIYKPAVSVYGSRAFSWDRPDANTQPFDKMPPLGGQQCENKSYA